MDRSGSRRFDLGAYLTHHGVKGQKWGVITRRRGGSQPSSDDAKAAADAKAKIKVGGTKVLSNKDLQSLVTRMNLEQQYSRLSSADKSRARKIVESLLTDKKYKEQRAKALEAATAPFAVGQAIKNVKL